MANTITGPGLSGGGGGPSEIGSVSVGVVVSDNTAAGFATVKARTEQASQELAREGHRGGSLYGEGLVGGALEKGHEFRSVGRAFHHSIMGAIAGPIIIAEAFELGQKIREKIEEGMESGEEKASNFLLKLGDSPGIETAKKNLDEVRKRLDEINSILAKREEGGMAEVLGQIANDKDELEAEKERLQKAERAFAVQEEAAKRAAERKKAEAEASKEQVEKNRELLSLQRELEREEYSQLDVQEQIRQTLQDQLDAIESMREGADEARNRELDRQEDKARRLAADRSARAEHAGDEMVKQFRDVQRDLIDAINRNTEAIRAVRADAIITSLQGLPAVLGLGIHQQAPSFPGGGFISGRSAM